MYKLFLHVKSLSGELGEVIYNKRRKWFELDSRINSLLNLAGG